MKDPYVVSLSHSSANEGKRYETLECDLVLIAATCELADEILDLLK